MPAAILTQQSVSAAADALVAAGSDPSIRTVQERIGGGSYTTVKRYLDVWKAERIATPPPVVVPEAIAIRGAEFTQALWAQATVLADEQTRQMREAASGQVAQAHAALAEAEAIIVRLEAENEAQGQELVTALRSIERLQSEASEARAAVQVANARVQELERQNAALSNLLEVEREAGYQLAKLEGEAEALRRQVGEQQAMIERLSAGRN